MNLKNIFKLKILDRDLWLRLGAVKGETPNLIMEEWNPTIKLLKLSTDLSRGEILEYIIQLSIIGVDDKKLIVYLGMVLDKAGFVLFKQKYNVFERVWRIIATGHVGLRHLHSLGLTENDVINGLGMSLDELNVRFKLLSSNQRAGILAYLISQKYD